MNEDIDNSIPDKKTRNRKPNNYFTSPSRKEWAALARKAYNNFDKQLDAKDDEGVPTMTPALATTVLKAMVQSETVVDTSADKEDQNTLQNDLKKKRKNRIANHPHLYRDDDAMAPLQGRFNTKLEND